MKKKILRTKISKIIPNNEIFLFFFEIIFKKIKNIKFYKLK